jgi:hypothetical protein
MNDSTLFFTNGDFIYLKEIRTIYMNRSNYLVRLFRKAFFRGGVVLLLLDSFDNIVNGNPTILETRVAIIGGSMIGAGLLMRFFEIKRIRPGKNKRLHVIDYNLR